MMDRLTRIAVGAMALAAMTLIGALTGITMGDGE